MSDPTIPSFTTRFWSDDVGLAEANDPPEAEIGYRFSNGRAFAPASYDNTPGPAIPVPVPPPAVKPTLVELTIHTSSAASSLASAALAVDVAVATKQGQRAASSDLTLDTTVATKQGQSATASNLALDTVAATSQAQRAQAGTGAALVAAVSLRQAQSASAAASSAANSIASVRQRQKVAAVASVASAMTASTRQAQGSHAANAVQATLFVASTGSNSNPGTASLPFATIAKASSVAVPGDVISVADGVYTGGFQTSSNGSAALPIAFVAANRGMARIVPPASSAAFYAWKSTGDYVTIDGFEVDGTTDPTGELWRVGLFLTGVGAIARNNHVHHIYRNGAINGNGGSGILLDGIDGGNAMKAYANKVHHVGPSGGGNGYHGIYVTSSGEVKNNITHNNTGGGIHCWHDVSNVVIANNTSFNNATWGIVYGGGDYHLTTGPADYITLANNIVYGNGVGIRELGDLGSHNLIRFNNCVGNGTNYALVVTSHTNDIAGGPGFVNYQADGSGDYALTTGSPNIAAASATYAPATDYNGATRSAPYSVGALRHGSG